MVGAHSDGNCNCDILFLPSHEYILSTSETFAISLPTNTTFSPCQPLTNTLSKTRQQIHSTVTLINRCYFRAHRLDTARFCKVADCFPGE